MMINTVSTSLKTILVSRMAHSMSDVSFRKHVSNVEERGGGKISLTRKKHSEGVTEGPLSECRGLHIIAGSNVLTQVLGSTGRKLKHIS